MVISRQHQKKGMNIRDIQAHPSQEMDVYLNVYVYVLSCNRFDPRQRQRIFLLASASKPALGPIQPPVQWVPGVLSPGVK
jgi:hypothetical protein